ncbi:MAG TPA: hypothetical protein VGH42_04800 [Verrucomicrobiae bacterium]|jgi:hypothetical protein
MNPSPQELKGTCQSCRQPFLFPKEMTGEKYHCPHCEEETILLPIITISQSINSKKPFPKKQFPRDEKWIQNIKNDNLRHAAKIFHDLFSVFVWLLLMAIGIPLAIFAFIEFMRFLHFSWGYN